MKNVNWDEQAVTVKLYKDFSFVPDADVDAKGLALCYVRFPKCTRVQDTKWHEKKTVFIIFVIVPHPRRT